MGGGQGGGLVGEQVRGMFQQNVESKNSTGRIIVLLSAVYLGATSMKASSTTTIRAE